MRKACIAVALSAIAVIAVFTVNELFAADDVESIRAASETLREQQQPAALPHATCTRR